MRALYLEMALTCTLDTTSAHPIRLCLPCVITLEAVLGRLPWAMC